MHRFDLMPWAWLILPLGLCRATQIVLVDRILKRPRDWINKRFKAATDGGYVTYLIGCPWCVSVWLGLATAALLAWDLTRRITLWVLLALTLSLCAVVLDRFVDRWAPDPKAPSGFRRPDPPSAVIEAFKTGRD